MLNKNAEIEYRYSEAPIELIAYLGDPIFKAIRSSKQWTWERNLAMGSKTDCLNVLVPRDRSHDISITLLAGWKEGQQLIRLLELVES